MKEKKFFFKEYRRRISKLLEIKLYRRNLVKRINTWALHLVRYSGQFLKWTREKLKQMDQRTRKLMTMHKALHHREDVDKLYVSRREEGRGLTSTENWNHIDTTTRRRHRKEPRKTDYSHQKQF